MIRTRFALLGVCAALVLTACGGDPVAPPPLTLPTTSSATVSPQPESAEEFIRRWIAADTRMQNTGDTSEYLALVDPKCTACTGLATTITQIYQNGGDVSTKGFTLKSVSPSSKNAFTVVVDSAPSVVIRRAGGKKERLQGGNFTYLLMLREQSDGWRILSIEQVAQ